ncbi:sensor histidine kinase [Shewanella sp. 125m-1]
MATINIMLRLYLILLLTLSFFIGITSWFLELEERSRSQLYPLEHALIAELFATQNDKVNIQTQTLQDLHWPAHLLTQLRDEGMVSLVNINQDYVFYRLANNESQVQVLGPITRSHQQESRLLWFLSFYILLALAVLLIFLPLFLDLNKLNKQCYKLGSTNFNALLSLPSSSMIKEIGDTFDHMSSELNKRMTMQRDLINAVSHELLTPLARIQFTVEAWPQTSQWQHEKQSLLQDAIELEILVEEFLTYAELQHCRPIFKPEELSPGMLVNQCIERVRPLSKVEIRCNCELPLAIIDERSFSRMVQNLLGNAKRFARSQAVVHIAIRDQQLSLLVEDDGPGMTQTQIDALSQAFNQLQLGSQRHYKGVGLGLVIVKQLCSWQHGRFNISYSQTLKGAAMEIRLPLIRS